MQVHLLNRPNTEKTLAALFPGKSPEEVALAAGGILGSQVTLGSGLLGTDVLHASIQHPHLTATRMFYRTKKGIAADHLEQTATGPLKGSGYKRFGDVVGHLKRLGVTDIHTTGTRNDTEGLHGHSVWSRFGFQGIVSPKHFARLPADVQARLPHRQTGDGKRYTTLHELNAVEGGHEAWREHGGTTNMHFDLRDGSNHLANWGKYLEDRERREAARGTGESAGGTAADGVRSAAGGEGAGTGDGQGDRRVAEGTRVDDRIGRVMRGIQKRYRRVDTVTKYAAKAPAHSVIAGHRIEHVLRHLVRSRTATSDMKALAGRVLHSGDTSALWGLKDELLAHNHPLANEYNWERAAWKLQLDDDLHRLVRGAVDRHREEVEAHNEFELAPAYHRTHNDRLEYSGNLTELQHYLAPDQKRPDLHWLRAETKEAVEGVRERHPHATDDDFRESLDRLTRRHYDEELYAGDREGQRHVREEALRPKEQYESSPNSFREEKATRFKRSDPVAQAFNGEFAKLGKKLGATDADHFGQQNHFGYLTTVAKGDSDLAHDLATHLLYGKDGTSPLGTNYDPARPLWKKFAGYSRVLVKKMVEERTKGTKSERFAGNFTDTGINASLETGKDWIGEDRRASTDKFDSSVGRRLKAKLRQRAKKLADPEGVRAVQRQNSRTRLEKGKSLRPDEVAQEILRHVDRRGEMSFSDLIRHTKVPADTLRTVVDKMADGKLLKTEHRKKATGPAQLVVRPVTKYTRSRLRAAVLKYAKWSKNGNPADWMDRFSAKSEEGERVLNETGYSKISEDPPAKPTTFPAAGKVKDRGALSGKTVYAQLHDSRLAYHLRQIHDQFRDYDPTLAGLAKDAVAGKGWVRDGGKDLFKMIGERLKGHKAELGEAYNWHRVQSGLYVDDLVKSYVDSIAKDTAHPELYRTALRHYGQDGLKTGTERHSTFWNGLRKAVVKKARDSYGLNATKTTDVQLQKALQRLAYRETDRHEITQQKVRSKQSTTDPKTGKVDKPATHSWKDYLSFLPGQFTVKDEAGKKVKVESAERFARRHPRSNSGWAEWQSKPTSTEPDRLGVLHHHYPINATRPVISDSAEDYAPEPDTTHDNAPHHRERRAVREALKLLGHDTTGTGQVGQSLVGRTTKALREYVAENPTDGMVKAYHRVSRFLTGPFVDHSAVPHAAHVLARIAEPLVKLYPDIKDAKARNATRRATAESDAYRNAVTGAVPTVLPAKPTPPLEEYVPRPIPRAGDDSPLSVPELRKGHGKREKGANGFRHAFIDAHHAQGKSPEEVKAALQSEFLLTPRQAAATLTGHKKAKEAATARPQKLARNRFREVVQKFARYRDSSFLDALRRLRSAQQQSIHHIAGQIHKALRLDPTSTRDAIHDTPNLSLNSVAQAVYHDSQPETVEYSAAWLGNLTQLPAVLVFHVGDGGKDVLRKVKVKGTGDEVRAALNRHGLSQRTLLPTDDGFHVLHWDREGRMGMRVHQFAEEVGGTVTESVGTGKVIGGGGEGARASGDSRANYRKVIQDYENAHAPSGPH